MIEMKSMLKILDSIKRLKQKFVI